VAAGRALGARGIAGQDQAKDRAVLGPHPRTLLGIIEHRTHRPFHMRPLRRDNCSQVRSINAGWRSKGCISPGSAKFGIPS
jgi:hypothetical protein